MDEMSAIMAGGRTFMERLQNFDRKKAEHDAALERLQLGKQAQAALDDAKLKQEDATRLNMEARAARDNALAEAQKIVDNANEEATAILAHARGNAEAHADAAHKAKLDAEIHAEGVRKTANDTLKDATAKEKDAQIALDMARNAADEHQSAVNKANEAKKAADDIKVQYEGKLAKLSAVLRELI